MARNWYGNKVIRQEDKYTKRTTFTKSDQYWEYTKMLIYLTLGYTYFHFIVMGWTW